MTKEDKDLLLQDLCARLPYGVMVDYENHIYILNEIDPACKEIDYITVRIQDIERLMCAKSVMIERIKPYLRPMSSMTEEERVYIDHRFGADINGDIDPTPSSIVELSDMVSFLTWLNAHHFDYRNLIERGLAIAVIEDDNPYKE